MIDRANQELTIEELDSQEAAELPSRELLTSVAVLGMPLLDVSGDISVGIGASGASTVGLHISV